MSVEVKEEITLYTYGSCPLTWEQAKIDYNHAGITDYDVITAETIKVVEKHSKKVGATKKERFNTLERMNKKISTNKNEKVNFNEFYWDYIRFYLQFLENLRARDIQNKKIIGTWREMLQTSDYKYADIAKSVKEYIFSSDFLDRHYIISREFYENLGLTADYHNSLGKNEYETFSIGEYEYQAIAYNKNEPIGFSEVFDRLSVFKRMWTESLGFDEYISKGILTTQSDKLHLYDVRLGAHNGVLSNISITEHSINLDEFNQAVNRPPNFTEFIEFKVGEYEYQEALVRLKFKTQVKQVEPTASDVVMYVDIPDTDDRGIATIADITAPTKVYYNKHYYNPPEVTVTLRGANSADGYVVPYVVSTDKKDGLGRYFEVELVDRNGLRKQGTINWVAKGY